MTDNQNRVAHYAAVRKVLWQVLAANLAVTILKIVLGFLTGALAVVADGFHSLVDSSSNLIGLAAIRLASRPADQRHPYGYRRYETIGALAIGGLLIVAAYEIGESVVVRAFQGGMPDLSPLTVGLIILTFPVNVLIYTLEKRAGEQLGSEILLADASHTRSDLFVTGSVIVSLLGVYFGLPWLDLLVAAGVAALILRAAFEILRDSAGWLTDAVAIDPDKIEAVATDIPGVLYVHRIRSRGAPDAAFVDLHVKVHPGMSTEQAHAIASEVERQLRDRIPKVTDALVHIEPARQKQATHWESIAYDLRQIADGMGLGIHDLHVHANDRGGYTIELHLEIGGDVSLGQAHALADEFEARVKKASTHPNTIITHLEPLSGHVLNPKPCDDPTLDPKIRAALSEYVSEEQLLELQTYQMGEHAGAAIRLCLPADLPLAEAHNFAEGIERALLVRFPELYRVTVHVEGSEDSS